MSDYCEGITIKDITLELQNLEKNQKSTETIGESYVKWKELRINTLDRLIQFVIDNPSLSCRKLMDFVWKKIFYVQISKLRPLLDYNSPKVLSITSSRRQQYEKIFMNMLEECLEFYKKFESKIAHKRVECTENNNNNGLYLKEAQVVCNICCGDLYRYIYNVKGTIVDSNNAIIYYKKAFLVDPNNDSSQNQLGILYKNDDDLFMAMFYFIKGCLNNDNQSAMIFKNKDITLSTLQIKYKSLQSDDENSIEKKIQMFKYGIIILVCNWLNLTPKNNDFDEILKNNKLIYNEISHDSLQKIQYLIIKDINNSVNKKTFQSSMVYVCVLLILSLEKLRKTDSSTFREALEFFIDIIYSAIKYSLAMIDKIYMLNQQKQQKLFTVCLSDDDDETESSDKLESIENVYYKEGYLIGRRAIRNFSQNNNGVLLVDSESDLSDNDEKQNHNDNHSTANYDKFNGLYKKHDTTSLCETNPNDPNNDDIIIDYALDHCYLDTLKIIVDWLTKSFHVIPVLNEITNDNILNYLKKNIKRIREVMYYFGLDDETICTDIFKEIFPEDTLVLDHYIFVDSKFRSWTKFDLSKKSHEFTQLRVQFLCCMIDHHKLFKKGGFDDLMKSLEYISKPEVISSSNVVISNEHRKNNKFLKNKNNNNDMNKKQGILSYKKFHVIKTKNNTDLKSNDNILPIKTAYVCIIEYGVLRDSIYLVKRLLNNPLMTLIIPISCIKKIDYHKKSCSKARECAKLIETTIASGDDNLQLQSDGQFISINEENSSSINKLYIPLIECALYYRKYSPPSSDINLVLSYHLFKKIKQNDTLSNYFHKVLIEENINYVNIEVIARKK